MWVMYENTDAERRTDDETLTFPVYATAEPWGFDGLHLPIEQVDVPDDVVDATLTLVEQAASGLGSAGDGQHVAHVYVTPETVTNGEEQLTFGRVTGWELTEQFQPE